MGFKVLIALAIFLVSNRAISQILCPSFSSYFGGDQFDDIKSVCVDSTKNSYVIGNTYSNNLPVTLGLINDVASGDYDVFIAKFDSCGALIWSTYFGGTAYESAEKMSFTNDGNIVFCGYTSSLSTPTTTGCFQPTNLGGYDCYLTKITPNGTIIWSTFFGKSGGDFAFDLKLDNLDNIIIGGTTTSPNLYTTPSSFQSNHHGNTDAFIARFSKNGVLKWCTYYGGNGSEDIHALAIDSHFNITGVGESFSVNLNTSPGAYQSNNNGASDTYILKLDSNGTRMFSTYIGGSGSDDAWGAVCNNGDTLFLAGHTNSSNFPTTAGSYQTANNGGVDCFLTKWSPTGALIKSTLFGNTLNDFSARLIQLSSTQLLLLAETESSNLPTNPLSQQQTLSGSYDVYLGVFDMNTLHPVWGTYYGGTSVENTSDVILADNTSLLFVGSTDSENYPVNGAAYQTLLNTGTDGFITTLNIPQGVLTSVQEPMEPGNVGIYPNPFTDHIEINCTGDFKVEIKTVLGQTIISARNAAYVSTKHLSNGVYFVTVNSKTYKLIKQ
jgi:hypothetical protein